MSSQEAALSPLEGNYQVLNSSRLFLASWLDINSERLGPKGELVLKSKLELNDVFPTIFLDYRDILSSSQASISNSNRDARHREEKIGQIKGFDERQLKYAIEEYTLQLATKLRDEAFSNLKFDSRLELIGAEQLESWLSALLGRPCEPHEFGVMQHWMHCVKRKMNGVHTEWQMFIIFYSMMHGPGKSRAVEHLLSPMIDSLVFSADEYSLKDDRRYSQFQKYSVGYFDEMAGVDKVSNETIKRIITSPTVSMRPLYGNDVRQIKQRCMFIGTSNKPVNMLINDTGMRRFWEFLVSPHVDHAVINAVDPLTIWRSINEDLEDASHYIRDHLKTVQQEQNQSLVTEDPVLQFLDYIKFNIEAPKIRDVRAVSVYQSFVTWCENNGYSKMSSGTFGKRLRQFRVPTRRHSAGMVYTFNSEVTIK